MIDQHPRVVGQGRRPARRSGGARLGSGCAELIQTLVGRQAEVAELLETFAKCEPVCAAGVLIFEGLLQVDGVEITVQISTRDGTATSGLGDCSPGADFIPVSETLTFPPGFLSQGYPIPLCRDRTPEPTESFFVDLSNPTNATIADGEGEGTIVDDD